MSIENKLPPAPVAEELSGKPMAFSTNGNLFWYGDATERRGVNCDLYDRPQPAIDVDALAEFIGGMACNLNASQSRMAAHEICNWIEEQQQ